MRILYVNDALAIWGGLERILVEKVNFLADEFGYEVHLITVNQGYHPIPYPLSHKVHYKDLGVLFQQQYKCNLFHRILRHWQLNFLLVKRLRKYIQGCDPDIIVSARSGLTAAIVSAKGDIPLVYESHTSRFAIQYENAGWYQRMKADWHNRSIRHAQVVVALTEGDAADWREINPNVRVIPNMVHLNESGEYSSCLQKSVIFVGRFSCQKNIGSLIQIWSLVHQRYPDWELHIYGGYGEEEDELLPKIEGLQANIFVHEPTSEILKKYRENSILLLTSKYEPFGLVIPEAMSCGLPVVAYDCPFGPAEIIADDSDGFLVKNSDIEAFVDRVCQLMDNESLRKKMGKAAIVSSQRYRADVIMPKWKQLFEYIINKQKL